eukprot:7751083-Pyramimonas_sp.AAC.1
MALRDQFEAARGAVTWASARGPISALWLTLSRVGWDMASATVLVDDAGFGVDLLRVSPSEVQHY